MNEESASDYTSEDSITGSSDVSGSDETASGNHDNCVDPLIQISDNGNVCKDQNDVSHSGADDFGNLMSMKALEL